MLVQLAALTLAAASAVGTIEARPPSPTPAPAPASAYVVPVAYAAPDESLTNDAGAQPLLPSCEAECCRPAWTVRAGAIFLQRGRPEPTPFIVDANTLQPLVNPNNFVFPYQAGADVTLLRRGAWADFECRYFGINDATASQGPFAFGPGVALAIPPIDGSPNPMDIFSTYSTSLNSVEFNLRRNVLPRLALLAGFRYVSLRDKMGVTADSNVEHVEIGFGTKNNLFGMQIGADGVLWDSGNRFRVESAIKAGVYGNGANLTVSFDNGGPDSGAFTFGRDHTAFVGDLNFTGVYQLTDRWAIRAGYQLLWLSGVAVSNEQLAGLNFDNNGNGPVGSPVNTSHSAFFHGALVGMEFGW